MKKWFSKRQNGWFTLSVISAFAAVLCFVQINGDFKEGWWIAGTVVFGLAAAYLMYKGATTSSGKGG